MPLTASKKFKIAISQDQMTATLSINGDSLPADVTIESLTNELNDLKLKISEKGKVAIQTFVSDIQKKKIPEAIVIAT
ncbi:MAG: hypothetical protein JW745_02930, partial [Sedimentisphaerales bacterium]|nr:hypothetical protein [Sedimentisphaerales bacterium]